MSSCSAARGTYAGTATASWRHGIEMALRELLLSTALRILSLAINMNVNRNNRHVMLYARFLRYFAVRPVFMNDLFSVRERRHDRARPLPDRHESPGLLRLSRVRKPGGAAVRTVVSGISRAQAWRRGSCVGLSAR